MTPCLNKSHGPSMNTLSRGLRGRGGRPVRRGDPGHHDGGHTHPHHSGETGQDSIVVTHWLAHPEIERSNRADTRTPNILSIRLPTQM